MINAIEAAVGEIFESLSRLDAEFCACARCKDDVMTLALNHLRPRYITESPRGGTLTRVALSQEQERAELTVVVIEAMRRVKASPRHTAELARKALLM